VRIVLFPHTVKLRLNVKYDSCNIHHPPESVCGIREQNEGNHIECLLA